MAAVSSEIVEENSLHQHQHQEAVSEMSLLSEEFVRIDMPSNPTPPHLYAPGLPPQPASGTLSMDEVAILALANLQLPPSGSLTRQAVPINRAASTPLQPSNLSPTDDSYIALNSNGVGEQQPIYRSRSVPMSCADAAMSKKHVRVLHVVPNRRMTERNAALSSAFAIQNGEEDQDNITEEEAVCRICLEELGEELETFKLECNCRGDLALVHKQCSHRWFNIRGSRTCEICRKKVRNITVKVRRMPNIDLSFLRHIQQPPMVEADRKWHELSVLYIVSSIAYFLSVEFLKLSRRSGGHIDDPYGIPSSIILALITAVSASAFAQRKHVWIYALGQLAVFTISAQCFYNLLHLKPLPTLVLGTVFAIGISRGARPVYDAIREARLNQLNSHNHDAVAPLELQPAQEADESHSMRKEWNASGHEQ